MPTENENTKVTITENEDGTITVVVPEGAETLELMLSAGNCQEGDEIQFDDLELYKIVDCSQGTFVPGEEKHIFSREKRFFPSPNPDPFQKKRRIC